METEAKEKKDANINKDIQPEEIPSILEVINIEELAVDGICGIY